MAVTMWQDDLGNTYTTEKEDNMTTEEKTRKPPDYTMSAARLVNPPEVKVALNLYYQATAESDELRARLEKSDLFREWTAACARATEAKANVIDVVKQSGSYQDIENGVYAIDQIRQKRIYHAEPFIENFPKYAPAVIEQTINVKALEGLVKGKLLTEDGLTRTGVITTTEEHAYIVK